MKYSDLSSLKVSQMPAPDNLPTLSDVVGSATAAGSKFFTRDTLRFFGDRVKNWRVARGSDGFLYLIRDRAPDKSPTRRELSGEIRPVLSDWRIFCPLEDIPETVEIPFRRAPLRSQSPVNA